jgi:hypothetical protein
VYDFNIPVLAEEILCNKPTMAVQRLRLAAHKAGILQHLHQQKLDELFD